MRHWRGRASLAVVGVLGLFLAAREAQAQTLLWMDRFDLAGGSDRAVALKVDQSLVFVVGWGTNAAGNTDFLVRAYDVGSVGVVWKDQFDLAGLDDEAAAVAVDNGIVYVAGKGTNSAGAGGANFLVRAYDAGSGTLLWMDEFDLAGGFDQALTVVAQWGAVYVGGSGWNGAARKHDFLVRAYYGPSGSLYWSDAFDAAGSSDQASALAVDGWQLFAAGYGTNAAGNHDILVRAYYIWGPWTFWTDQFDLAGGFDDALSVAAQWGVVTVAGRAAPAPGKLDYLVRAYDAWGGGLLWTDQLANGSAEAIVMNGGYVIAAGDWAPISTGYFDGLVRAYDMWSGAVVWTDSYNYFGGHDSVFALATDGTRVLVGGMSGGPTAPTVNRYVVREYDFWSGKLLWDDAFSLAKQGDWALTVALDGGRAFTAGVGTYKSQDFLVRVYEW